jgi:hypothetical protein
MTRRLSPEALREAAEVAAAMGVSIVIEDRGRVYRIDPHGHSFRANHQSAHAVEAGPCGRFIHADRRVMSFFTISLLQGDVV